MLTIQSGNPPYRLDLVLYLEVEHLLLIRPLRLAMAGYPFPPYFDTLAGGLVLVALYYLYHEFTVGASRRRIIRENGCKPPAKYPHVEPIVGVDLFIANLKLIRTNRFLPGMRQRFMTYGNTFQLNFMGTNVIATVEPENLKTILSLKFKEFGLGQRRKTAMVPLLGDGIFTTDGGAWQHSREMLRPNFTRNQVGDLDTFERHIGHLIQAIPRDGSTVDLSELFFRLTIDSATEFLFGESTNSLAPGTNPTSAARFADAFNYSQHAVANHFRLGSLSTISPDRKFRRDVKYVHDFVDSYVMKALEYRRSHDLEKADINVDERYVFLHELAKQTNDPIKMRAELLNILLAGRDTTASLLSNVWHTLARRPDIWAKLRAEVDAIGGERPSFAQVKDLKYLRYTLNECKLSSDYTFYHSVSMPNMSSSPPLPRRTRKPTHSSRGHLHPHRWRSRRQVARLRPERHYGQLLPLYHASTQALLWRGRRGV